MRVLPAIARELRAQSRLPFTYGVRVLGAAALLFVGFVFTFGWRSTRGASEGAMMFSFLNTALFIAIWALVPLLTADCISRERREGTMGLLFMTPLKARDIVLAKGLVHGLRALTLWLAVLPIMMIPFLQGGVGWRESVLSVLVNFSVICLALAAGILASSLSKKWLQAQVLACLLGSLFALLFLHLTGLVVSNSISAALRIPLTAPSYYNPTYALFTGGGVYYGPQSSSSRNLAVGVYAATGFGGQWATALAGMPKAAQNAWLVAEAWLSGACFLFLVLAVEFAARRVRNVWREEPPSAGRLWLAQTLVTPVVAVGFLKRWMRRKLDRNPIGWLEQRTWSGRLVTWSWLAVMISLYSAAFAGTVAYRAIFNLQQMMAYLLLVGVASSAAGSFQRERETGVMELLLVSPMSVRQIIGGRLRGLWGQFLPAMVLLLSVYFYFRGLMYRDFNSDWAQICVGGFLFLPVIGLYYSLRRRSFIAAFLFTLFAGLVIPLVVQGVLNFSLNDLLDERSRYRGLVGQQTLWELWWPEVLGALKWWVSTAFFVVCLQALTALVVGRRLYRDMERRNFTFSRVIT